jgi:hypothetical protein
MRLKQEAEEIEQLKKRIENLEVKLEEYCILVEENLEVKLEEYCILVEEHFKALIDTINALEKERS